MDVDADEDEVVFRENDRLRVLRGTIVAEDDVFVHVSRQDGEWSIRKQLIEKIHRRPPRSGGDLHT